jgi:hypothetical protein
MTNRDLKSELDSLYEKIIEGNWPLSQIRSEYEKLYKKSLSNLQIYNYMYENQNLIRNKTNKNYYWISANNMTKEQFASYLKIFAHKKNNKVIDGQIGMLEDEKEKPKAFIGSEDKASVKTNIDTDKGDEKIEPRKGYSNDNHLDVLYSIEMTLTESMESLEDIRSLISQINYKQIPGVSQSAAEANTEADLCKDLICINNSKSRKVSISINQILLEKLKEYINNKYNISNNDSKVFETAIIELLYNQPK